MSQADVFKFVDIPHAVLLQRKLASKVLTRNDPDFVPGLACGMDVAYEGDIAYATAAVYDLEKQSIIETQSLVDTVPLQYIPGFLGFREGPLLLKIVRQLTSEPDVYFIDGHGRCHPRRFGIACHVGLALDQPTIGVAKSYLYGKIVGNRIKDPKETKTIGEIIVGSTGKKFFVSVGHKISLSTAVRIVRNTLQSGHPVPLRRAHLDSLIMKRRQVES